MTEEVKQSIDYIASIIKEWPEPPFYADDEKELMAYSGMAKVHKHIAGWIQGGECLSLTVVYEDVDPVFFNKLQWEQAIERASIEEGNEPVSQEQNETLSFTAKKQLQAEDTLAKLGYKYISDLGWVIPEKKKPEEKILSIRSGLGGIEIIDLQGIFYRGNQIKAIVGDEYLSVETVKKSEVISNIPVYGLSAVKYINGHKFLFNLGERWNFLVEEV